MRHNVVVAALAATLVAGVWSLPAVENGRHVRSSESDASSGLDLSIMDRNANPANDYQKYVFGKWNPPLPGDKASLNIFVDLSDRVKDDLRKLFDDVREKNLAVIEKGGEITDDQVKIGYMWDVLQYGKDDPEGNKATLSDMFEAIENIKTKADLEKTVANMQKTGTAAFFSFGSTSKPSDSSETILAISSGGLGLSDKSMYTAAQYKEMRDKYQNMTTELFKLYGLSEAEAKKIAEDNLEAETKIAASTFDSVEANRVSNLNTVIGPEELPKNWDWEQFFGIVAGDKFDFSKSKAVNVQQPNNLNAVINELVTDDNAASWKPYLKTQLLMDFASSVSPAMDEVQFDYTGRYLSGLTERAPEWQRNVASMNGAVGMMVGKLYCEEYYTQETQRAMAELIQDHLEALKEIIAENTWMSEETKREAEIKRSKMVALIGCPEKWQDYSDLAMNTKDNAVDLARRVATYAIRYELGKVNKPVDRSEWGMSPQTVNAYYDPTKNLIAFPAAILQSPSFDPKRDLAVNYGAIGAVIGHELTHGFDTNGRQFDADGNFRDWWTREDTKKYNARTKKIVDQYNKIEVIPDVFVDGELTLTENTADIGGLKIAYRALQNALEGDHKADSTLKDGLTPSQRFFVAASQFWKTKMRPAALKQLVATDPHAPGIVRTWAPGRNLEAFAEAFSTKEGDKYYLAPDERGSVW